MYDIYFISLNKLILRGFKMEENLKSINNIESVLDDIVFLDIETSSLNPNKGEILEIGAIKFENNKISTFNTLVKNKREIPLEVFSLCKGLNINDFIKEEDAYSLSDYTDWKDVFKSLVREEKYKYYINILNKMQF